MKWHRCSQNWLHGCLPSTWGVQWLGYVRKLRCSTTTLTVRKLCSVSQLCTGVLLFCKHLQSLVYNFESFVIPFSVHLSSYGCTWDVGRALVKRRVSFGYTSLNYFSSLVPSANFPPATITRWTHDKPEPILNCKTYGISQMTTFISSGWNHGNYHHMELQLRQSVCHIHVVQSILFAGTYFHNSLQVM